MTSNKTFANKRYRVSPKGIIFDTKTGLEWFVGPDEDTTWDEAKAWTKGFSVGGGGWKMPSLKRLKEICEKDKVAGKDMFGDEIHLDPAFKTTGAGVWAGKLLSPNSLFACCFDFYIGCKNGSGRDWSSGKRGLAVRTARRC